MTLVANLSAPEIALRGEFILGPQDIPIYIETFGDRQAAYKVICIQGPLLDTPCFYMKCAALAEQGCYIVVYDIPWHGFSIPWEEPFASGPDMWPPPHLWAESLDAVRDHLGLFEEEVCLLAWSFGGQTLRQYLDHRGTGGIVGLILVGAILDTNPYLSTLSDTSPALGQELRTLLRETAPMDERLDALLAMVECLWHQRPSLEDYYLTLGAMTKSFCAWQRIGGLVLTIQGESSPTVHPLRCPALLIQGQQDRLVPRAYTRRLVSQFPEGLLTLCEYDQCGHMPFLEHSDRFQQDILRFLNRLRG